MSANSRVVVLVLVALLAAVGFHDVKQQYDGFALWDGPPAGYAAHPIELGFLLLHLAFGGVLAACTALAVMSAEGVAKRLEAAWGRLATSAWLLPGACLLVLAGALAVKDLVLASARVSDDEGTYVFIAQTLAQGRVVNPPPPVAPADLGYFGNAFIVLSPTAWYGKYPIGWPLLLAIGEALDVRVVVGPLLAVATTATTFAVARRLLGAPGAALAVVLTALSPQLTFTAATEHSQNATQLAMMLALLALLGAREGGAETCGRNAALAGAALGFEVLARPMPGVLHVAALGLWVAFGWREIDRSARAHVVARVAVGVTTFLGVLGWVNLQQSGHPLVSGYQVVHGRVPGVDEGHDGIVSSSLASAALRQQAWAFGWPSSFLFVPFARATSAAAAATLTPVWLLLAATYAYRLSTPKVFVGTTGPIYVEEAVPLLAILTAAGMLDLRRRLHALRPGLGDAVAGAAVGSAVAALVLFVPVQVAWIARVAAPHHVAPAQLAAQGVERAIVFATDLPSSPGQGWALHPPPPSPTLEERILYVRRKKTNAANVAFWEKHFPDRAAFVLDERRALVRPLVPGSERPLVMGRSRLRWVE